MNTGLWPTLWAVMSSGIPTSDDTATPQRRQNRDATAREAQPQPATNEPVRVLCIDDDPHICVIVKTRLKVENGNGWIVECAHSLHEALGHLSEHQPDVILLDLCLGDSEGIETFERIHRVADGAAIVVMTGLEENEIAPPVMMEGAQDFISKPKMDIGELPQRLCQAIESRRLLDRIKARNKLSDNETTGETYGACHV